VTLAGQGTLELLARLFNALVLNFQDSLGSKDSLYEELIHERIVFAELNSHDEY
jgi:hypothetical protein